MPTAQKTMHCVGKHKALPMGANFRMDRTDPSGSRTSLERVAIIGICQEEGKIFLTRSYDKQSLAELKSRVSIKPVLEPI
jgi:hypothetical protein